MIVSTVRVKLTVFNLVRSIMIFPSLLLLFACASVLPKDDSIVKGAVIAYYYDENDKLIYAEDMQKVPERRLHKMRNIKGDSPFPVLMSQCKQMPKPESDQVDVMKNALNGTPNRAVYIDENQVLAYEDLTGLPSRKISALTPLLEPACSCWCPPCSNPPAGYNCCCPKACRS